MLMHSALAVAVQKRWSSRDDGNLQKLLENVRAGPGTVNVEAGQALFQNLKTTPPLRRP
jgi:hypothetical protein